MNSGVVDVGFGGFTVPAVPVEVTAGGTDSVGTVEVG